jgi:hypothetical protein
MYICFLIARPWFKVMKPNNKTGGEKKHALFTAKKLIRMKLNSELFAIAFFLLAAAYNATAQWSGYTPEQYSIKSKIDYPLAGYLNPDFRYTELRTVFGLNGFYNNSATHLDSKTTSNNLSISPGGAITSYSIQNNTRQQSSTSWRIQAEASINNNQATSGNTESETRQLDGGTNLYYHTNRRFYSGKRFLETSIETGFNFRSSSFKQETNQGTVVSNKQDNRDLSFTLAPRLLAGTGRLEQTSNAWQAVQLLRELQRVNRLADLPPIEKINVLADEMTRLRNQRGFDYRIKLTSDLVSLDSTLRASGLLTDTDVVAFATLNDIWSYAPRPDRTSGTRWYAGVESKVAYIHNYNHLTQDNTLLEKTDVETTKEYNRQNYNVLAGVVSARPLNTEWQRTFSAEIEAGYGNHLNSADQKTKFTPSAIFSSTLEYSFYPNTRTVVKANITAWLSAYLVEYNKGFNGLADETVRYNYLDAQAVSTFQMERYLSPALSFNLHASINYNHTQSDYELTSGQAGFIPAFTYDKKFVVNGGATVVYQIR